MRADAAQYTPFELHFELDIVAWFCSREAADLHEATLIRKHDARGKGRYNSLLSTPANSEQFWMLHPRGAV